MKKLKAAFASQKCAAIKRGIKFQLSFIEWLDIWNRSGKLPYRGRGAGKYCMARYADVGPYAVENVKIVTWEENLIEANTGRLKSERELYGMSLRMRGNSYSKGLVRTEEYKAKLSASLKGRVRSPAHCKALSEAKKRYFAVKRQMDR